MRHEQNPGQVQDMPRPTRSSDSPEESVFNKITALCTGSALDMSTSGGPSGPGKRIVPYTHDFNNSFFEELGRFVGRVFIILRVIIPAVVIRAVSRLERRPFKC